jgi:hypothetical protein
MPSIEFLCKSYPDLAVAARIPELLQAQRADLDRQAAEERVRLGQGIEDDDMSDDEEQVPCLSLSENIIFFFHAY